MAADDPLGRMSPLTPAGRWRVEGEAPGRAGEAVRQTGVQVPDFGPGASVRYRLGVPAWDKRP